jgi:hypothetical protein
MMLSGVLAVVAGAADRRGAGRIVDFVVGGWWEDDTEMKAILLAMSLAVVGCTEVVPVRRAEFAGGRGGA